MKRNYLTLVSLGPSTRLILGSASNVLCRNVLISSSGTFPVFHLPTYQDHDTNEGLTPIRMYFYHFYLISITNLRIDINGKVVTDNIPNTRLLVLGNK